MHFKLEAQHTSEIVTKHANVVKFCFDFYGVYLQEKSSEPWYKRINSKPSALGDTDCRVGNILLINNSHIRNRSLLFDSDVTFNYDYIYARLLPQDHWSGSQVAWRVSKDRNKYPPLNIAPSAQHSNAANKLD